VPRAARQPRRKGYGPDGAPLAPPPAVAAPDADPAEVSAYTRRLRLGRLATELLEEERANPGFMQRVKDAREAWERERATPTGGAA
jgi:hypothetical protein